MRAENQRACKRVRSTCPLVLGTLEGLAERLSEEAQSFRGDHVFTLVKDDDRDAEEVAGNCEQHVRADTHGRLVGLPERVKLDELVNTCRKLIGVRIGHLDDGVNMGDRLVEF